MHELYGLAIQLAELTGYLKAQTEARRLEREQRQA
jgi:hypothetical protein